MAIVNVIRFVVSCQQGYLSPRSMALRRAGAISGSVCAKEMVAAMKHTSASAVCPIATS